MAPPEAVFEQILFGLLNATPGAIGAVFLDQEGESVHFMTQRVFDIGAEGLKAIGAYQGIYLAVLKRICGRVGAGRPQRFTIGYENTKLLTWDLKDGYYIVLILDGASNEGAAWHHLRSCRERLLAEI